MVSTLWMVNSLGYPMAESALTMLATVGIGYATYLWMEPNAKVMSTAKGEGAGSPSLEPWPPTETIRTFPLPWTLC